MALLAALAVPATASAGILTTSTSGGVTTIKYTGSPGEVNTVDSHFQFWGHWFDIYDKTAPVWTNDPNCSVVHSWQIHCILPIDLANIDTLTDSVTLNVDLGDDNDSFAPSPGTDPYRAVVNGGPGIDEITLGRNQSSFPSMAYAGDGNDILRSNAQPGDTPNFFFGDGGDDFLVTANGATDRVVCGDGTDYTRADGIDDVSSDCETVKN